MTTASAAITGGSISGTSIDLSGQTLTLTADSVSGDSVHGGTISNFASTGIDDNATATALTIDSSQNATFGSDLTVTGDLTVNGSVTSISSTNTTIEDNTIVLNNGESGAGVTEGSAGISIDRGTADDALINWNETTDEFELKVGASYGDLKVSTLTGDLTGDSTGAHNGTVGATTPATGAFTTINASGTITGALTGNVTGNVSGNAGTVTNGVYTTDTGTVTNTMLAGSIANNKLSNSAVTIGSTSLSLGTSATTIAGLTSVTSTDFAGDLAGDVTSTGTSTFATVDINGGAIDGSIIGATTSAAGTFSALNSANATITGGAISGATLTSSSVDIDGGAIDATTIGANTSAAGTFSTLSTASAAITGGTASLTTATATNLNSGNATITGGAISGTSIDLTGQTLTLTADSVSGNAVHGGTISSASLAGAAGTTISAYDITVGAGKTLDVSSADALTLANNQISGDKVHSGTISDFASTGIDDNATSTKLTLSDTTATFGVNGDFGANTLTAGASTLDSLSVTGNASVSGNLTVSGSVTTTLSETVNIEDNEIVLNSNETGAPSQDGGVVIERGTSDNAALKWNETSDSWELNVGAAKADLHVNDLTVSEIALTNELPLSMGGTHTDTSGYAADSIMTMSGSAGVSELAKGSNSTVLKVAANGTLGYAKADLTADVTGTLPIANGGTGITSAGSDNKVMMSDGSALGMEYVQHVRNSSGVVALDGSGVSSGSGEYVAITNATGKVTLTAKNAAASGAVDMYLQGQGGGDVFIVGQSGEALIQGEDDTDLTVAGGDASGGDAGDLIVKGGNGTGGNASGSVVIKGGNGGSADGNVQIKGADDTAIATFVETASATDHLKVTNGTGGVELAMAGGTNVNMTLAPKGSGILLAPNGYDMSSAADSALATKDYVDDKSATSGSSGTRRVAFTANGSSSFTIGTMANISGKSYYVSRISAKVTTPFVGCDELVVSDGTNTLMTTTDADLSEGGLYIVDLGFELATTGGATITGTLQNGGSSASPTTGVIIVTAEYKQI
jgi:hypothetical protein